MILIGFLFFGAFAPLAAHLSDKISRSFLMIVYHFGIGLSSILAAAATNLWLFAMSLSLIGIFAAIYHPVGITMLLSKNKNNGVRMGINGVFGNMGVAAAPLITGLILFYGNWRLCFLLPGLFCLFYGLKFLSALSIESSGKINSKVNSSQPFAKNWHRALSSIALSTLSAGFIFGAMTFIIPRYFETYLSNISTSVAVTGLLAGIVYATASFAQIFVGKMIDKFSPKLILLIISAGQILFIYFSRWIPSFVLNRQHIREIFHFSSYLSATKFLNYFTKKGDLFLIGKFLGDYELGIYSKGYQLTVKMLKTINGIIIGVLFPSISIIKDNKKNQFYVIK